MIKTSIAFIIVTYNSEAQLSLCLDSLLQTKGDYALSIVAIDNFSQDGTLNLLKQKYAGLPKFYLIENKKNTGFAAAVNQGIEYAKNKHNPDYYFLLNPDATIAPDCLEKMVGEVQKSPRLGLASPLITNPVDGSIWFAGGKINWLKFKTEHISLPSLQTTSYKLQSTNYLSGCALLIKKELLEKIGPPTGGFDERFFLYYEDADFSLRTKRNGFQLAIVPEARCFHNESQSSTSDTKNYHLVKSGLLFFHKHYPWYFKWYFWMVFCLRIFCHKYISTKDIVLKAMREFFSPPTFRNSASSRGKPDTGKGR